MPDDATTLHYLDRAIEECAESAMLAAADEQWGRLADARKALDALRESRTQLLLRQSA